MTTVAPWHSKKENHYHNNDRCGPGGEIPQHNREAGTANIKAWPNPWTPRPRPLAKIQMGSDKGGGTAKEKPAEWPTAARAA
jgi:hypothetical protein